MARMITPEAILSYPQLFTPKAMNDGDPKFSCTLIFPGETDISELKRAVIETAQEKWGSDLADAELKVLDTQHGPANFLVAGNLRVRVPWRDHPDDVASKGYPEGSTFFNVRSTRKPGIVTVYPGEDGKPQPLEDESKIYPGAIVRASLSPFAYDNSGNTGVTFGLGNVQWIRDGERLDGNAHAADEFEADPDATADLSDLTDEGEAEGETVAAGADGGDDLSDLIG